MNEPEKEAEVLSLLELAKQTSNLPISEWTDSVFIGLSDEILQKTGTFIHRGQIKTWYKKIENQETPDLESEARNAIARMLQYADWADYFIEYQQIRQHPNFLLPQNPVFPSLANPAAPVLQDRIEPRSDYRWLWGVLLLLICLWGIVYFKKKNQAGLEQKKKENTQTQAQVILRGVSFGAMLT